MRTVMLMTRERAIVVMATGGTPNACNGSSSLPSPATREQDILD